MSALVRIISAVMIILYSTQGLANISRLPNFSLNAAVVRESQANDVLATIYSKLALVPNWEMSTRLQWVSQLFLNKPYLLGALGEGNQGRFDKFPMYRTDAFDCETFVATVLAIALSENLTTFKQCMRQIRYRAGVVSFFTRNHFTSADWNTNNQRLGILKDVTNHITDNNGKPIAKIATAIINKPAWYKHFDDNKIREVVADDAEKKKRLSALQRKGQELEVKEASIPYIPLSSLFNAKQESNNAVFQQIPDGSIIQIIRPNWNLEDKIGTRLNVSHTGFGFWKLGTLYYRETSSTLNRVVDIPLIDYLRETLKSPTIKGINIQIVLPQHPMTGSCSVIKEK